MSKDWFTDSYASVTWKEMEYSIKTMSHFENHYCESLVYIVVFVEKLRVYPWLFDEHSLGSTATSLSTNFVYVTRYYDLKRSRVPLFQHVALAK